MSLGAAGFPGRVRSLRALRRLHAWIGLAGASLGLLFGTTGFLLNHRAVMKLPGGQVDVEKVQIRLESVPATPADLAGQLAEPLGFRPDQARWQVQAPRAVRFAGAPATASAAWTVMFGTHRRQARATYLPGNQTAELEWRRADLLGSLQRMHKADAGHGPWILLADAFAGALVFLTLSGMLLWSRLAGPRLLALGLGLGGLALLVGIAALGW